MALVSGVLVEVSGMSQQEIAAGFRAKGASPQSHGALVNGERAQLLEFLYGDDKWLISTFSGVVLGVAERFLQPLTADKLSSYDLVVGPKSEVDASTETLASCLASKGYAVVRHFVEQEQAEETLELARRLDEDGCFARLAREFERGYFGVGGVAKVMHLDSESGTVPEYVKNSALAAVENNLSAVCHMLKDHAEEHLGFGIYNHSDMLLRMPLSEDDEDRYPPAECEDREAEEYMHMMYRKQLTAIQFAGPSSGSMTLIPQRDGLPQVDLTTEPHTMVFILSTFYEYSYFPASQDDLALQCFYMSAPPFFEVPENAPVFGATELLRPADGSLGAPPPSGQHVTVESMYCRYGGEVMGYEHYWAAMGKAGTDGVTKVPIKRWDNDLYYDPDGTTTNGCYTQHGCFGIEGVELFDCKFFDISPSEAKIISPMQRQIMEVSYVALASGGFEKRDLMRKPANVGHFVGADKDDWLTMSVADPNISKMMTGGFAASAAANAILANRFSFSLNLKGPSMTIDTACSSSLVATHVGKLHLRSPTIEMEAAIVNGCNILVGVGTFISCCAAGMLSHMGRCFTFNASADGYLRGETCGAMCMKPKTFDENSFGCLAGTDVNQDGRSASLTAPNGPAQEKCIRAVLREAKLDPSAIDIFECHGTGTALGDPIEVSSLRKVFDGKTPREFPLCISSSKSNIGHGEGGAGLAGFLKCLLQVSHSEAAPSMHLTSLNPHIDLTGFAAHVVGENIVMAGDGGHSGVSSFGFGGTNAHCQAWGRNVFTSRGPQKQSPQRVFQKKLSQAPPAEITINGDDVRDWETTGIAPDAEQGVRYRIDIDEYGVASWERDDEDLYCGEAFYVRGSHNDWKPEALEPHGTIDGLHTGSVTLGSGGSVQFHIIADADESMVFHPGMENCTSKAQRISGPEEASKERCWLLRGAPGETFRIEFYQREGYKSLIWLRQ